MNPSVVRRQQARGQFQNVSDVGAAFLWCAVHGERAEMRASRYPDGARQCLPVHRAQG
ncbi:protein of unknown function [Ralstonia solanacearum CFBP2957]|nr:protein of unknown function [Ralstonia solanacearum CFBP2957]